MQPAWRVYERFRPLVDAVCQTSFTPKLVGIVQLLYFVASQVFRRVANDDGRLISPVTPAPGLPGSRAPNVEHVRLGHRLALDQRGVNVRTRQTFVT